MSTTDRGFADYRPSSGQLMSAIGHEKKMDARSHHFIGTFHRANIACVAQISLWKSAYECLT